MAARDLDVEEISLPTDDFLLKELEDNFRLSKAEQIQHFLRDQRELDRKFDEYALNSDEEVDVGERDSDCVRTEQDDFASYQQRLAAYRASIPHGWGQVSPPEASETSSESADSTTCNFSGSDSDREALEYNPTPEPASKTEQRGSSRLLRRRENSRDNLFGGDQSSDHVIGPSASPIDNHQESIISSRPKYKSLERQKKTLSKKSVRPKTATNFELKADDKSPHGPMNLINESHRLKRRSSIESSLGVLFEGEGCAIQTHTDLGGRSSAPAGSVRSIKQSPEERRSFNLSPTLERKRQITWPSFTPFAGPDTSRLTSSRGLHGLNQDISVESRITNLVSSCRLSGEVNISSDQLSKLSDEPKQSKYISSKLLHVKTSHVGAGSKNNERETERDVCASGRHVSVFKLPPLTHSSLQPTCLTAPTVGQLSTGLSTRKKSELPLS